MIPTIIFIGLLMCIVIWGAYIVFKPPKDCCLLVKVHGGDTESEINLQRATALAGKGINIVVVEENCSEETHKICSLFCFDNDAQIIDIKELPPVLKENLQSRQ